MTKREELIGIFYGYRKEVEYEISQLIKKGVESLFSIKLPPHNVKIQLDASVGITRFVFQFLNDNKEIVFANSVEVELHSQDYIFKLIEDENVEVDYSIKHCSVTSNQRSMDNQYHSAQLQVAAFIMSKPQSIVVRNYISDISVAVRDRLKEHHLALQALEA